mgnify:CR=1 FL=1
MRPKEPTTFVGRVGSTSSEVETFVDQVERYFALFGLVDETMRATLAATWLDGDAALWHRALVAALAPGTVLEWPEMRRQLLEHWRPVDALARARNAWAALRQTGSVSEYTA